MRWEDSESISLGTPARVVEYEGNFLKLVCFIHFSLVKSEMVVFIVITGSINYLQLIVSYFSLELSIIVKDQDWVAHIVKLGSHYTIRFLILSGVYKTGYSCNHAHITILY